MQQPVLEYSPVPAARISLLWLVTVLVAHLGALAGMAALAPALPEAPSLVVQILPAQLNTGAAQPTSPASQPAAQRQSRAPEASSRSRQGATEMAPAPSKASSTAAESPPATPAAPAVPVPTGEVAVSAPRFDAAYLENPAPVYPPLARRLGEEGVVWLRVQVAANGTPSRIEIKTSSGSLRLDQAAEQAVWRWKFIPAKRGNEALAAWVVVPVSFNLRG